MYDSAGVVVADFRSLASCVSGTSFFGHLSLVSAWK